jgi:hypothetical protein
VLLEPLSYLKYHGVRKLTVITLRKSELERKGDVYERDIEEEERRAE